MRWSRRVVWAGLAWWEESSAHRRLAGARGVLRWVRRGAAVLAAGCALNAAVALAGSVAWAWAPSVRGKVESYESPAHAGMSLPGGVATDPDLAGLQRSWVGVEQRYVAALRDDLVLAQRRFEAGLPLRGFVGGAVLRGDLSTGTRTEARSWLLTFDGMALDADAGGGWTETMYVPLRPRWPGFVVNTAVYAAGIAGLWWFWWKLRRALGRGACPRCGYAVGGAAVCTECGAGVERVRGGA